MLQKKRTKCRQISNAPAGRTREKDIGNVCVARLSLRCNGYSLRVFDGDCRYDDVALAETAYFLGLGEGRGCSIDIEDMYLLSEALDFEVPVDPEDEAFEDLIEEQFGKKNAYRPWVR